MKWKPFNYNGESFDLSHLHPFGHNYIQPAKGENPERSYRFDIEFSIHCFTYQSTHLCDPSLKYSDSRESRTFCFNRYNLSKNLPSIIKGMGNRKCFHTGHSNYFIIEVLDKENGTLSDYEVYFKVSKSAKNKGFLNMFVQSAYIREEKRKHQIKPIAFPVIAYNTLNNKPIKIPK